MSALPVLTFHALDSSASPISFAPDAFERLMRRLADRGWSGGGITEALQERTDGSSVRRFAISFDDGYRSVHEHALPILRDLGFSATVFVITDRVGRGNQWPGQAGWVPEASLMDWDELGALSSAGWEVGSHGRSHTRLTGLHSAELEDELRGAVDAIRAQLAVAAGVLAYPYGAHDEAVRRAAAGLHQAAVGVRLARATPADLAAAFEIPRIDAYYLRGFPAEPLLSGGPGAGYLALRRWGRRLARRH